MRRFESSECLELFIPCLDPVYAIIGSFLCIFMNHVGVGSQGATGDYMGRAASSVDWRAGAVFSILGNSKVKFS